MECVSCFIFETLESSATWYAQDIFDVLAPWTRDLFAAFIGFWAAWHLFSMMWFGRGDLKQLGLQLLGFTFITAILQATDFYFDWFYHPLLDVTSSLTQMVVSVPSLGVEDTTYEGLLRTVEHELYRVLEFSSAILSSAGTFDIHIPIILGLFILPFVVVWAIFLAFLAEGMFKLLAVTAVGPLLLVAAGFKPTRGFTMSGIRIALNGVLTVVFAGVAMGFTLAILQRLIDRIPFDENGDMMIGAHDFLFSLDFFGLFIVGLISVLFHLKAATIASNISGAMDGPGAAATVAAAGVGLASGMAGVAGLAGRKMLGTATGTAGAAATAKLQGHMQDNESVKAQILRRFLARR